MKEPENLFYKTGYELSLENSKSLLKIADKAAEEKEYGIACSLNILAAEEAMKTEVLMFKYFLNLNLDPKDVEDMFHNHKIKHSRLKELLTFSEEFYSDFLQQYHLHKVLFEKAERVSPASFIEQYKKDNQVMFKVDAWIERQASNRINFKETFNWLESANNTKNRGLYVNKVIDGWQSPKDITKDRFESERKYTMTILEFIDLSEQILKDAHPIDPSIVELANAKEK